MPIEQATPQIPVVNMEVEPLKLGGQTIDDSYAKALVVDTFNQYELYRTQNHDRRWNIHDQLYYGWVPQRVWEGTQTPRSSLAVQITFDQVEAALPQMTSAVFPADDWFQVSAEGGATPQEARDTQDHLRFILEHPRDEVGSNGRIEIEQAIKSALIYGNGGVWLSWDPLLDRPVIEHVPIQDFYVDPGCPTPSMDDSKSVIRRKFMTVEELEAYREDERFKLPVNPVLIHMSRNRPRAMGDQTKQIQASFRGVYFSPGTSDYQPLPAHRTIEVLIYYSKSRIIWLLNREWVAFNDVNPYKFIPACFAPCYTVPNQFYAMSFCDVQEGNQRYGEALVNAHLDELSLSLNPPRIQKAGSLITPSQSRWRPGLIQQAANPKEDALIQYPQQITTNIFPVLQMIKGFAEERTGVSSLMTSGVAKPGNANRTATGMTLQAQGGSGRVMKLVENIENYLIVPLLYKLYKMVQMHTKPTQQIPAMSAGPGSRVYPISARSLYHPMRFTMHAASRMITKDKLGQLVPFLAQYLMAGPLLAQLAKSGKTVDFDEFVNMVQDATNTSKIYRLIRPMSPQEQQAAQQPPPEIAAKMQSEQQSNQVRLQMGQMKVQGDLQKTLLEKQPDQSQLQMDAAKTKMQMELNQQKMQIEALKAQMEQQKMQMEIMAKRADIELKGQAHQQTMMIDQQKAQADQQRADEQHQTGMRQQLLDHLFKQQQLGETHQQKLAQGEEMGKVKVETTRKLAEIKGKEVKKKRVRAAGE